MIPQPARCPICGFVLTDIKCLGTFFLVHDIVPDAGLGMFHDQYRATFLLPDGTPITLFLWYEGSPGFPRPLTSADLSSTPPPIDDLWFHADLLSRR